MCLCILVSCHSSQSDNEMGKKNESWDESIKRLAENYRNGRQPEEDSSDVGKVLAGDEIERLAKKHKLQTHYFDTECLYEEGDLSAAIIEFLTKLLPNEKFRIAESLSNNGSRYVAQIFHTEKKVGEVVADVGADYLPENFFAVLEAMPTAIGSENKIYMANPRLFGQEACYVSGKEEDLMSARGDGLPLVLPTETMDDIMAADISRFK